ncbi:hypothetical protein DN069_06580 [Streptacidiphilus pinicola]|uniref:Uncharacterized protein n=1 Tax=Streptacidiphilus pinicola TaxID=2219663 RepID=A0A2X0IT65_9ACTN|nr:hypothetical protein [Streptacidiphilus pinicola]RAG86471.1 hypothetical protein DN069_06580 [Streptacidiphilus pinicola]
MTRSDGPLSNDAHYLQSTAHLFSWEVEWEPDGSVRMSRGDQTVRAFFGHDGAFWFGRTNGPDTTDRELALSETVAALELRGDPSMPPAA